MPRDLVSVKRELEEAIARIPGTPATPLEEYFRYEECLASLVDSLAYSADFASEQDVEVLCLYALKLAEVRALELDVVLDFEG